MSNFPLAYKASWLPRFLRPSLHGDASGFSGRSATLLQPAPKETVRLVFLGDISAVASALPPVCDPALAALIASADLVIANCESPVVGRPYAPFGTWLGTRHAMDEAFLLGVLKAVGVEPSRLVLSVANNHALDQGADGFQETLATLGRLGIDVVGTMARPILTVRVGGMALGFLAFTQWRNRRANDFAGRVLMAEDMESIAIGDDLDLFCILPHWDYEFRHSPQAETLALAHRLRARGAGLVVGHHAHVLQPLQAVDGGLVAFGLGDFLGTALPYQPWPGRIGAVLSVDVSVDDTTRGRLAGFCLTPFMRRRESGREHLVCLENLPAPVKQRVASRLAALYGPVGVD